MTLKTTEREKQMDQAISKMRQPYDYRITKERLDKAAAESREDLAQLRANKKQ